MDIMHLVLKHDVTVDLVTYLSGLKDYFMWVDGMNVTESM